MPLTDLDSFRFVLFLLFVCFWTETTSVQMQALLYLMLAIADDEENQKNGVVCVAYYVGTSKSDFFAGTMMDVGSYIRGAPIRFCAIHFCTDGPTKQVLIARFLAILTNDNQVKRRVHYGACRKKEERKRYQERLETTTRKILFVVLALVIDTILLDVY